MDKLTEVAIVNLYRYRGFLLALLAAAMAVAVACGGGDDSPDSGATPSGGNGGAAESSPSSESAGSSGALNVIPPGREIPRGKTLISYLGGAEGRFVDHELWNPYAIGANHQSGPNIIFEPLAFFSAFADETIPWLATDWSYNGDFTELTINLRQGVQWSDGEEFNADDVVYTLNTLKDLKEQVRWGTDIGNVLNRAEKTGSHQVKVFLDRPDPRFFFLLTYKFDIGVYMVPEHHYRGKDWTTFKDFDPSKGFPLTTGPWQVVSGSPEQKVIDRRDSWWGEGAADLGPYAKLPEPERIIYLPTPDQTARAQSLIADQVDYSAMTTPAVIADVLKRNPDLITHTGKENPLGYVDWWPVSLAFNNSGKFGPYDNPDVRWAFSKYLNREELRQVAYDGAAAFNPLTMPQYPPLQPYFDAVAPLLQTYNTLEYDPDEGDALLEGAGFTKNAQGMWVDDRGNQINCEIIGFSPWIDLGPITAEQLRKNGINASYIQPPDASSRMAEGDFECLMFGHGGSVRDPYFTMKLYQSSSVNIPGGHQVNFYHWENAEWDRLTDEIAKTDPNNQQAVIDLYTQAMEIWLKELPDVPILEFYHRIVMNEKRWTNWPRGSDTDGYVNEASWHLTWPLVLHRIEAKS